MAAGIFGDDRNGTVAHLASEEARRLAVGAAPGAAAGDLYGSEDAGKRGIEVQVHRRPILGIDRLSPFSIGYSPDICRLFAHLYRFNQLGQGLLSFSYGHEIEMLQNLLRQGGWVGTAGDEDRIHQAEADHSTFDGEDIYAEDGSIRSDFLMYVGAAIADRDLLFLRRHVARLQRSFGRDRVWLMEEKRQSNRVAFAWTGEPFPGGRIDLPAIEASIPRAAVRELRDVFATVAQAWHAR